MKRSRNRNNNKNNKNRRRKRRAAGAARITGIIFVSMVFLLLLGLLIMKNPFSGNKTATLKYGWNLILINSDHYIPDDYELDLTELSNGEKVDSRIYPSLQNMFDDARAEGLHLFVAAGYRTEEEQQRLLDEKTEAYEYEGYSESEAARLAKQWVAVPGTSEHQIGIAVDVNADTTYSSSDDVYGWLAENAHKYGFIKRYPSDKTDITGVINEPWHFRYVGPEAALEIYNQGLCLEEYIELLEE